MWPNKEESGGKTLQVCAKIDCQDLYAGLAVLARRTSDMTDRFLEIRRESGHSGNYIPSGRQLPRTPPFPDVKRHLDFSSDTDCENMEPGAAAQHDSSTFDFIAAETKTEPDDHSMLKGMTGYQLTPSDLEFIEKMQEDKIIKKLQRDLEEVQRLLQMEKMAAELVHASREKAQAELSKFPSCEELTEWVTVVLKTTSPSTKLTDVDTKSLLSVVTKEDIQRVVDEKRAELARLDKMVANKRKREAEERERLEKQIVSEQLKTQGLMSQLSDLKSELAQQEEAYKAFETQTNNREIKMEAEKVKTANEIVATKSQVKHRGRQRKKAVKSPEKMQSTTEQNKSPTSEHTDSQISVKDHRAEKNTFKSVKTKPKSGAKKPTKSEKAARGPQNKVEVKESDQREAERSARGRRRPPTAASRPKNQSKVMETGEAPSRGRPAPDDAGEEAQNGGLRRSKRIASRR